MGSGVQDSIAISADISAPTALLRYKRETQLNWEESDFQSSFSSYGYSSQHQNTSLVRQQPVLASSFQEEGGSRILAGAKIGHSLFQQARLSWGAGDGTPFQHKLGLVLGKASNSLFASANYSKGRIKRGRSRLSFGSSKFKVRLLPPVMLWGVRSLEFLFNRRIYLETRALDPRLLSPIEYARCEIWISKLRNFTRSLGAGFFLTDTVHVLYLSLRFHNPYLMIEWLQHTLIKVSFWKYRSLFHFLRYIFRFFLWPVFGDLGVRGVKFKLKGKISVSGNARTRTISTETGRSGKTTTAHRVIHLSRLIPSFTGVMGFQVWFFF